MAMTLRRQAADGKTDAMVDYSIGHREADGHWASRSNRQPLPPGDHHATAFGIYELRSDGRPSRRMEIDA